MNYELFKVLHVVGAVLFIGNLLLNVWWKLRADRRGDARLVAFTLDQMVASDLRFTVGGAVLLLVGGGGMLAQGAGEMMDQGWLSTGILLFLVALLAWAVVLLTLQRQLRARAQAAGDGPLPDAYRQLNRYWLPVAALVTLLPLVALVLMVAKPGG